jgi:hypothetical protein
MNARAGYELPTAVTLTNLFKLGSGFFGCPTCGSRLPPYPSDPPPPMTTPFALFFLILGSVMVVTVGIDPSGTLIEASNHGSGTNGRDVLASLTVGTGLFAFGGVTLILAYKHASKGVVRWICRRCGSLFPLDQKSPDE